MTPNNPTKIQYIIKNNSHKMTVYFLSIKNLSNGVVLISHSKLHQRERITTYFFIYNRKRLNCKCCYYIVFCNNVKVIYLDYFYIDVHLIFRLILLFTLKQIEIEIEREGALEWAPFEWEKFFCTYHSLLEVCI